MRICKHRKPSWKHKGVICDNKRCTLFGKRISTQDDCQKCYCFETDNWQDWARVIDSWGETTSEVFFR